MQLQRLQLKQNDYWYPIIWISVYDLKFKPLPAIYNCQYVKQQSAAVSVHWLMLAQRDSVSTNVQIVQSSCRSLDLSFWMQTCALLTFMSLKCSDTERWSHWQRPALARRELLECGLQRANTRATCAVTRNKDMSEKMSVTCDRQILTLTLVY